MLAPVSTKERIVLVAERLFAARGLDGVSLREIGVAAGSGNNSVVQYHFGSKEQLAAAIFEYRLPALEERRRLLVAQRHPDSVRSWVECYVLPILEQGEMQGSYYLSFISMLHQHHRRDIFERVPAGTLEFTRLFREQLDRLLARVPEPLRSQRITQAVTFAVHATSDRERAQERGQPVLPFAAYVADLLDCLVGFLEAPVSPAAEASVRGASAAVPAWLLPL